MNETAYFAVGSLVFYTTWYTSLGWFSRESAQRQDSLHFWTKETTLEDLPRETFGQKHRPVRKVSYPRLVLAVLTCSIVFYLMVCLPVRKEAQTVCLGVIALASPVVVVFATYLQFPIRFIPITWGGLIGVTAVASFITTSAPWGVQPTQLLKELMPAFHFKTAISVGVFGLIPLITGWMAAVGCTKPPNWFAWCIVTMSLGSTWVLLGLLIFKF
ncbi:MAG: hypothetical protein HY360_04280 [Verrucomicrobia bacterium]|nr:hypothetical protein [Verrucomicrobiota bacterium]